MRSLTVAGALVAWWAVGAASTARAEYYSWVDEDGVLHLTAPKAPDEPRPYEGHDLEYFGGNPPLVLTIQGRARTAFRVDVSRYDDLFVRAGAHYNLPPAFLKAVAKVESNFNPRAVSHAKARGLMQLIAPTARKMKVKNVFDPEQNVFGGARYLRLLANMFGGDLTLTTAAYNAGPRRVKNARGVPQIRETQRYVARVRKMYDFYRERGVRGTPGRRAHPNASEGSEQGKR